MNKAFTLIELIVVMGIFALLASLTVANLIRPQTQSSLESAVLVLVADVRQQQAKSMFGDAESSSSAQPHGVYFDAVIPNAYTLFKGSQFSSSDSDNFTFSLEETIVLSTALPSSQVVFTRQSGEVSAFVNGQNTITLRNTTSSEQKTITINRYGVITID